MTKLGFAVNLDACSDHRGCMAACKAEKGATAFLGAHFVETFTAIDDNFPNPGTYFLPMMCQHCDRPACAAACDEGIISKREDGLVVMGDTGACKGCAHPCVEACPYDRVFWDPKNEVAAKCDGCADRVDAGVSPACIPNCWMQAIAFGDFDDPESPVSQLVAKYGPNAHVLNEGAGTGPNVRYLLATKKWKDMEGLYSPAWHNDDPELALEV